jgi:hypothetical protein
MKTIIIILVVFAAFFNTKATAQTYPSQVQMDNAERKVLKDSVGVSDEVINSLFDLRNQYFTKSDEIHKNKSFTELKKAQFLQELANETNKSINKVMGDVAFQKYMTMIERNKRLRKSTSNRPPLASAN